MYFQNLRIENNQIQFDVINLDNSFLNCFRRIILSDVKSMNNKTRIVVSHNLNVLKNCDVVYELKKNELINFKSK